MEVPFAQRLAASEEEGLKDEQGRLYQQVQRH